VLLDFFSAFSWPWPLWSAHRGALAVAIYLEPIVGPAAELHLTVLIVEGEPCDVDLTGGHEDAGGDVGAEPLAGHHHVGRVGPVKCLAGAEKT
jgi:hypothetical protein